MKNTQSKAKNNTNAYTDNFIVSPLFDIDQMKKTVADSVQMYLDQKPMIDEIMRQQAPLMSEMAKQVSESAKMYHSIFANFDMPKFAIEAQEQHKKMQESIKDVIKMTPINFGNFNLGIAFSPYKQKEIKEKIEEEIFEEVIEKIEERSEKIVPLEFRSSLVALPANAKWEDIKIVFRNKEDVKIYYKEKCIIETNCEKLGFARNNTTYKTPNKQWEFLHAVAIISNQKMKKVKPTVLLLKNALEIKNNNAIYRVKLRLERQLERAFGIDDPFQSSKEYKCYKPKFELVSEPGVRNAMDPWSSGRGLPKSLLQ